MALAGALVSLVVAEHPAIVVPPWPVRPEDMR